MKKYFTILAVATLTILAASCGSFGSKECSCKVYENDKLIGEFSMESGGYPCSKLNNSSTIYPDSGPIVSSTKCEEMF